MDKKELVEYLKEVRKPDPPSPAEQERLKIMLMNARRSSVIGLCLIALPGLIITLFFIQTIFRPATDLTRWICSGASFFTGRSKSILVFLFMVGFPLIAVGVNLLSITYFRYQPLRREFHLTVRMRWWNILVALAGAALASFYILHILADALVGTG
jgi:hypothetical protein